MRWNHLVWSERRLKLRTKLYELSPAELFLYQSVAIVRLDERPRRMQEARPPAGTISVPLLSLTNGRRYLATYIHVHDCSGSSCSCSSSSSQTHLTSNALTKWRKPRPSVVDWSTTCPPMVRNKLAAGCWLCRPKRWWGGISYVCQLSLSSFLVR